MLPPLFGGFKVTIRQVFEPRVTTQYPKAKQPKPSQSSDNSGQVERLARRGTERNLRKLCDREPAEALTVRQAGGGAAHFERVVVVGDGMADLADARAQFGGGEIFGRGQVPESGHATGGRVALGQQDAASMAHHQQRAAEADGSALARFHRQLRNGAFLAGAATFGQRADQAERMARQADGGAEFHQRLIEMAGLARVHPLLGDFAEASAGAAGGDVGSIVGYARQHAEYVAVQDREGQVEGDASDGDRKSTRLNSSHLGISY